MARRHTWMVLWAVVCTAAMVSSCTRFERGLRRIGGWFSSDDAAEEVVEEPYEEEEEEEEVYAEEEADDTPSKRRRKKPRPPKKKVAKATPKPAPKPAPKPKPSQPKIFMPGAAELRVGDLPKGVNLRDLHQALMRSSGGVEGCLDSANRSGEKFAGTIILSLTIDQYGKVSDSYIRDDAVERSSLGQCIMRKVGGSGYPSSYERPIRVGVPIKVVR